MKTVLTGVKPTGMPHIGNYLGAMKPAIELSKQEGQTTYLFVADYHSLTATQDAKKLSEMIYEVCASWLACGLDPKKAVLYRQSDIPEIFELTWVLSCMAPKGLLNRAHAYKAKVQENVANGKTEENLDDGVNMGLYNYPVLMAADILMFSATHIPVGEDQNQHLEIARDIAQKFNRQFGEVLKVPQAVLQKDSFLIPGVDGRKMSKSYDNHIPMFLDSAKLRKTVMKIKTDSLPPEAPKETKGSIIFDIYRSVASVDQQEALAKRYAEGIGWGHVKEELFQVLDAQLAPMRERYNDLMNDKSQMDQILKEGAERAREHSSKLMHQVRKAIGIERA